MVSPSSNQKIALAKVVLNAVTSENPSPKYLAGKDIETLMEAKRSMSDEEFSKMMMQGECSRYIRR
jgi:hypothetical protein